MWQQWINALLGLWVVFLPFTGMVGASLMWALVITGIAVAVFALWGIQKTSVEYREEKMVHRMP